MERMTFVMGTVRRQKLKHCSIILWYVYMDLTKRKKETREMECSNRMLIRIFYFFTDLAKIRIILIAKEGGKITL